MPLCVILEELVVNLSFILASATGEGNTYMYFLHVGLVGHFPGLCAVRKSMLHAG